MGALFDKPDIFGKSLIHLTDKAPLRETIRECHLKLTNHCICMPTEEHISRFVIYESKIRLSIRPGAPKTKYLNQISSDILQGEKKLEANEIRKMAGKIMNGANFLSFLIKKSARTDLLSQNDEYFSPNDDENNRFYFESILSILFRIKKKSIWKKLKLKDFEIPMRH